jgi:hypothetical protein
MRTSLRDFGVESSPDPLLVVIEDAPVERLHFVGGPGGDENPDFVTWRGCERGNIRAGDGDAESDGTDRTGWVGWDSQARWWS